MLVLTLALTLPSPPGEGFLPGTFSDRLETRPTNPATGLSKAAGSVSPSPRGRGPG